MHVLSKLAPKIPSGEREGLFLTPSSVFSVYAVKLFWDGDQKADDQDKEQEVISEGESDLQFFLLD